MPNKCVSYVRVSTQKQGASGLGLEAQQSAVRTHINSGGHTLIAEFVEIESGKNNSRPKIKEALDLCKKERATLVIAKLDRLARNVAFIANLMDAGVDFTACDFPQANRLTIHLLAAVAEHEAKAISDRTKAALTAAKARGKTLGRPKGCAQAEGTRISALAGKAAATAVRDKDSLSLIAALNADGKTHQQIADFLNAAGKRPYKAKEFSRQQVGIIIRRNSAGLDVQS